MFQQLRHFLELIRFSHTVFALPFAMLSAVIAWSMPGSEFRWRDVLGILVCMVTARSAAMAFNRLVDREIDAENPRTAKRHLPAGLISGCVYDPDESGFCGCHNPLFSQATPVAACRSRALLSARIFTGKTLD